MAGERMTPAEALSALKVATPNARLYSGETLIASPSSTDRAQLICSPKGYWSALGRLQTKALDTSSEALTILNGRRERHLDALVTLFSKMSAMESQTQGALGELMLLDERLTFQDLWVIMGSSRESRIQRSAPLLPLRLGFKGAEGDTLQTLSFDVFADPINKIDGLKVIWGEQLAMLTNLEGELRSVGRLPTRLNARELESRAHQLLSRLDWTRSYKWVSFEATGDVMLSEFYTLARLIHSLSGPGIAQRGGTPLQFIIHLKQ